MADLAPEDIDGYISTLRSGECISERSLKRLCAAVSELLVEESNVQPVRSPVTVRFHLSIFKDFIVNISAFLGH